MTTDAWISCLRLFEARNDSAVRLEEQLLALEDMRQEGKLDLIASQTSIRRRCNVPWRSSK